jgi:hypothetical protein
VGHHELARAWIDLAASDFEATGRWIHAGADDRTAELRWVIEIRAGDRQRASLLEARYDEATFRCGFVERRGQLWAREVGCLRTIDVFPWPVARLPDEDPLEHSRRVRGAALARLLGTPPASKPQPDATWWREGVFDRYGLGAAADLTIAAEHLGDPEVAGDLGGALPRLYEAAMRRESVVPLAVLRSF